jgi:hypothetical protein
MTWASNARANSVENRPVPGAKIKNAGASLEILDQPCQLWIAR